MGVRRSQIEFAASCALFAAILLALIIAALVLDPLSASVP
jgi:hypothetical protein